MTVQSNVNERPTMAKVIQTAIEARLCNMHTCLPGIVTAYDSETQKATVQPEIRRQYINGDTVDLPAIQDVPIVWPRGGGAVLHFPLAVGDQVLLVFSERSVDEWKEEGGQVLPEEFRKFDLSDAFAIPGGYPFNNPSEVDGKNVQLKYGNAELKMTQGGKFNLKGVNSELFDLLVQLTNTLANDLTNTMLGPQPLLGAATYASIKAKLEAMKA